MRSSKDPDINRLYRPPHFETYAAGVCIKESGINYAFYRIQECSILLWTSGCFRCVSSSFNHFRSAQSRKVHDVSTYFSHFQTPQLSIFTGVSDFDFTGFGFGTLAGFVALAFGVGELELCRTWQAPVGSLIKLPVGVTVNVQSWRSRVFFLQKE